MARDSDSDDETAATSEAGTTAGRGKKKLTFKGAVLAFRNWFYLPSVKSKRVKLSRRHAKIINDFRILYRRKCRAENVSAGAPVVHWLRLCERGFEEFAQGRVVGMSDMSLEALNAYVKTLDEQPDSTFKCLVADLSLCVRSKQAVEMVRDLLKGLKSVGTLHLDHNLLFGDKAVAGGLILLEGLKENKSLKTLTINRSYTPDPEYVEFFTKLADIVLSHPKLENLEISFLPNFGESKIGIEWTGANHKGIEYLLQTQTKDEAKLRRLILQYCEITDLSSLVLKQVVRTHVKLKELDVSHNQLTRKSFEQIADSLKNNQFLTSLSLYHNRGGDAGVTAVLKAAAGNRTLKRLDLGLNGGGEDSVEALCELIKKNNLEHIGFSYNLVGIHGPALADALVNRQEQENAMALTSLHLAGTRVRTDFVKTFCGFLEDSTLEDLDISHNQFEVKASKLLARACMRCETLVRCDIGVANYARSAGIGVEQEMRRRAIERKQWEETDDEGSVSEGLQSSGEEDTFANMIDSDAESGGEEKGSDDGETKEKEKDKDKDKKGAKVKAKKGKTKRRGSDSE